MGDKVWIMERKLSSGFRRIFTVASDRLGNVNDCPTGIEPPTVARNNRKSKKNLRNTLLRFLFMLLKFYLTQKDPTKLYKRSLNFLIILIYLEKQYHLQLMGHYFLLHSFRYDQHLECIR